VARPSNNAVKIDPAVNFMLRTFIASENGWKVSKADTPAVRQPEFLIPGRGHAVRTEATAHKKLAQCRQGLACRKHVVIVAKRTGPL
jgi:hypothetical protein